MNPIDLKTHSSRIAISMAASMPTGLATGATRHHVPRIWKVWMTFAALAIATTLLTIAVLWLLRKAL